MATDTPETLEQRLQQEAGIIQWAELERHFARGVLLVLSRDLDIVAVGEAIVRDETASVEQWTSAGKLRRATLEDAHQWHASDERFRALVIAPWVLAQPGEPGPSASVPPESASD